MRTVVQSQSAKIALNAIVCLDGSARAAEALAPALMLAKQRGETIAAIVLDLDGTVMPLVNEQLAAVGLPTKNLVSVTTKSEMVEMLLEHAQDGATPVLSAFGRADSGGHLSGILGELVRADVERVLAVGPSATSLSSSSNRCIVVSADGVCSIDPLIEATSAFVLEATPKILVAHVVPPSEPGMSLSTNRDAAKFRARFDVPVEAAAVAGVDISRAIADLARQERASLILARSWHRFSSRQPPLASSSLSIVAEAPCPVLIVN